MGPRAFALAHPRCRMPARQSSLSTTPLVRLQPDLKRVSERVRVLGPARFGPLRAEWYSPSAAQYDSLGIRVTAGAGGNRLKFLLFSWR